MTHIPRYVAVLHGMSVRTAKAIIGEHDLDYWRDHPEELRDLVERIRTGMSALREAGHPEWGTALPIPKHEVLQAQSWKPGQYIYDEIEEKAVAEAFKEKGKAAWNDPRVTNSKWYRDCVGERIYWRQRQNARIRQGEEILKLLGISY